jgi:uncharacterized protein (DUF58 family)
MLVLVRRRHLIAALLTILVTLAFAPAASAMIRTGNQNPDVLVVASISPNHADVGERVTWSIVVTNTSDSARTIRFEGDLTTPFSAAGVGGQGRFGPHESFTFSRTLRAREGGEYLLHVWARTASGTRSHASAHTVA